MDTQLLQKWLGLSPGDWPPEPHVLLGLPRNAADGVQDRAVALMERLRPHQLRHPELVTEGMNRLAQALISVEEAAKRAASLESTLSHAVAQAPTQSLPPTPVVLDAEVVEVFPLIEAVPVEVRPVPRPRKQTRPQRTIEAPVAVPARQTASTPKLSANRRKDYQSLALHRRVARGWSGLGPFFGVPSRELLTSGDVFGFLEAAIECRKALVRLNSWPIPDGGLVRSVLWNQASLCCFRDLQPSQRLTLAADWANALAQWQSHSQAIASALKASKPRRTWRLRLRAIRKWAGFHPEWKLAAFVIATLAVSLVRMLR